MSRSMAEQLATLVGIADRVAASAAPAIESSVVGQYQSGTDPYGTPWAPLAASTMARGRRPPPLTDTGDMAAGTTSTASGDSIVSEVPSPGGYHQSGTARMPARKVLPDEGDELPVVWTSAIEDAIDAEVKRCLG